MNSIAEHAGTLGLFATANALADAKLEADRAPRDARLTEPVADDTKRILAQMARRGHEPALVAALWDKLANRPLERALVALDVLAQGLLGPRDPLLDALQAAATTLRGMHPPPGELCIDLNKHPARDLIDHFRDDALASRPIIDLLALAYEQDLGVLDELARREDDLVTKPATQDSVHAFARLASLARLPTLASVYFDWLLRVMGRRGAGLDLCETLFDAGVAQKIPGTAIQPGDVPERDKRDVGAYLLVRSHLGVGDSDTANAFLMQNLAERPRWIGPPSLRLDVVRAHLGVLYGYDGVSLPRIEAACSEDRLWRYGAKVRAIVGAKRAGNRALDMFHSYVTAFGNDFELGEIAISLVSEPVKRDITRILCREALHLPHEPAPWKLLGLLYGAGRAVADEVDQHLRTQSG